MEDQPSQTGITQIAFTYEEILAGCKDFSVFSIPSCANYTRINMDERNFYLDFYLITPSPNPFQNVEPKDRIPIITPIKRMMIPLDQLKGLASAIVNMIATIEESSGVQLPNLRGVVPGDKVNLWPE